MGGGEEGGWGLVDCRGWWGWVKGCGLGGGGGGGVGVWVGGGVGTSCLSRLC